MTDAHPTEATAAHDRHEDFLRLYSLHEPALRAFVRVCLPRAEDLDEVMQAVSVVAWRKYPTLDDPAQFPRWACLIARYEVLKFRRTKARDRLVLDEDIVAKLADEGVDELSVRKRQLDALEHCLERLPDKRRKLALTAYAPETSMRDLAGALGRSPGSLYQLLARIRQDLLRCVERKLAQEAY